MQCAKAREIQCPRIGEAEVEQWLLSTLLLLFYVQGVSTHLQWKVTEILSPNALDDVCVRIRLSNATLLVSGRVFSPSISVVGSRTVENEAVSLDKVQEVDDDLLRRLVHLAHQ